VTVTVNNGGEELELELELAGLVAVELEGVTLGVMLGEVLGVMLTLALGVGVTVRLGVGGAAGALVVLASMPPTAAVASVG
jgi:hypothetical protein